MKKGLVSLVGAGPGDPELLTLKAMKRLKEADLVVYDTLANPEHLSHVKKSARCLCVGRDFRHKKMSQDKINRLILDHARKGRHVVRLKGGDPYLFGRGGEEALYLVRHHIPFEVIPGVTSANGCAAYAGIPLTHRDHNASVTFLTGHRAEDGHLDSVDWQKIASISGTIAIYMGFYNLPKIARRLMECGLNKHMPVAVVEWGTLPWQKSCEGTLENIVAVVKRQALKAPCMIIVGDVVRLREKLNWFEHLPLFGKKVLVTRMKEKAGTLADKFRRLGAWPVEIPVIEIERKPDGVAMDRAIRGLRNYDWAVFTSAYGVESFFERLKKNKKDSRALNGIRIACVGPETARALRERGIEPDLMPKRFETAALVEHLKKTEAIRGKRFLLLRTDIAPKTLEDDLRRMGAVPDRITAYRTRRAKISKETLRSLFCEPVDFVTFTSSSAVTNLVKGMGLKNIRRLARHSHLASIGPVTSRTLRAYGLKEACQAVVFDTDGLVGAVRKYAEDHR